MHGHTNDMIMQVMINFVTAFLTRFMCSPITDKLLNFNLVCKIFMNESLTREIACKRKMFGRVSCKQAASHENMTTVFMASVQEVTFTGKYSP